MNAIAPPRPHTVPHHRETAMDAAPSAFERPRTEEPTRDELTRDEPTRDERTRWVLQRNCVLTPQQLLASFAGVAVFEVLLGVAFWWLGYPGVAAFVALELLAVALALLAYMPSARDRDTLALSAGGPLLVEQHRAAQVHAVSFDPAWVRVELDAGDPEALVTLSCRGTRVQVGRHALPPQRQQLARELRRALAQARALAIRR